MLRKLQNFIFIPNAFEKKVEKSAKVIWNTFDGKKFTIFFFILNFLLYVFINNFVRHPWFDEAAYSSIPLGWSIHGYAMAKIYYGEASPLFFHIPESIIYGSFYNIFGYSHETHRLLSVILMLLGLYFNWKLIYEFTNKSYLYANISVLIISLHHSFVWMITSGRPEAFYYLSISLLIYLIYLYHCRNESFYLFLIGIILLVIFFSHAYLFIYFFFFIFIVVYIIYKTSKTKSETLREYGILLSGMLLTLIVVLYYNPNITSSFLSILDRGSAFVSEQKVDSIMLELKNRLLYIIKYNPFIIPIILIGVFGAAKSNNLFRYFLLAILVFILFLTFKVPKDTWYQIFYINVLLLPISAIAYIGLIKNTNNMLLKRGLIINLYLYLLIGLAELSFLSATSVLRYSKNYFNQIEKVLVNYIPKNEKVAVPYSLFFKTRELGYDSYSYLYLLRGSKKTQYEYSKSILDNGFKYFIFENDKIPESYKKLFTNINLIKLGCFEEEKRKINFLNDSKLNFCIYSIDGI